MNVKALPQCLQRLFHRLTTDEVVGAIGGASARQHAEPGTWVSKSAWGNSSVPANTSPSPGSEIRLNIELITELRRSHPTTHVGACCANATARFTATVVLPSPGKKRQLEALRTLIRPR